MFYTVYQTTNLVNGKTYIGMHTTSNVDDLYLGSGQLLKTAIQKHGKASFKKEVLFVFDNAEDMAAKETELVNRSFVDREDTYNLVPGGFQGDSWYQSRKGFVYFSELQSQRGKKGQEVQKKLWLTSSEWSTRQSKLRSEATRKLYADGIFRPPPGTFKGKKHSSETRLKMSLAKKGIYEGAGNPSFGSVWVCIPNEMEKKVPAPDVPSYLEGGWIRGRKSGQKSNPPKRRR